MLMEEIAVRERRGEKRVSAELTVTLDGLKGVTRDVSATGIFFETASAPFLPESTLEFTVIIETLGVRRMLKCQGSVMRIAPLGDRFGVAVKILDSMLAAKDQ